MPFQLNTKSNAETSQNKRFQLRPMHEYVKMCIRYNMPNTINNTTKNIIDKQNTHRMQGFFRIY